KVGQVRTTSRSGTGTEGSHCGRAKRVRLVRPRSDCGASDRGSDRLEHSTIVARRETGHASEQATKEGDIFVADRCADVIDRCLARLEHALRRFDAQVLNVVSKRMTGCGGEAPFQCALRYTCEMDDFRDRVALAIVLGKPLLAASHDRVRVRGSLYERAERKLPFAVPLQQIDLRDPQGFARAAVSRNDMKSEIVPGGRAARGYDAARTIREDEVRLRTEIDLRVLAPEQLAVTPMRGRAAAVQ